jgi:2-iminobutanoate/2-iminopropanoate deaminase
MPESRGGRFEGGHWNEQARSHPLRRDGADRPLCGGVPPGYELILVSGTPGLDENGALADNITDQARQAWRNIEGVLANAGASLTDIVSVRQWLADENDVDAYWVVRREVIKHEIASMMAVVDRFVWPSFKVELEVIAAKPPTS